MGVFFDARDEYTNSSFTKAINLVLFGTNTTGSVYIIAHSSAQDLQYGKTIYAKSDNKTVNASKQGEKLVLSVHYNRDNSFLFVNGIKGLLTVGNVTEDFSTTYQERTGSQGKVYYFVVNYISEET